MGGHVELVEGIPMAADSKLGLGSLILWRLQNVGYAQDSSRAQDS